MSYEDNFDKWCYDNEAKLLGSYFEYVTLKGKEALYSDHTLGSVRHINWLNEQYDKEINNELR